MKGVIVSHRNYGFTLVELMVVLSIVAIVSLIAIPTYRDFIDNRRLVDAAEFISGRMNFARVEALKQSKAIYVGVTSGGAWNLGVGDQAACDGSNSTNCTISTLVNGSAESIGYYYGNPVSGSSVGSSVQVRFDPIRGTASNTSITVSNSSGESLKVKVSLLGRVIICSDSGGLAGYPGCL